MDGMDQGGRGLQFVTICAAGWVVGQDDAHRTKHGYQTDILHGTERSGAEKHVS
jgi:hypothetical protein